MELPRLDRIPSVATVMTPFPYSVAPDDPITAAEELMRRHAIHHVPVQDGTMLVGVVTERDLALLVDTSLTTEQRARISVRDVYSSQPYVVDLHESLGVVARELARRHLDSALVMRDGRLAGIFTLTDACRVLAHILGESGAGAEPDDVA